MGYKQRHVMTFEDYVDLFQDTARQIRASMESETLHQQILITGEVMKSFFLKLLAIVSGIKHTIKIVTAKYRAHVQ